MTKRQIEKTIAYSLLVLAIALAFYLSKTSARLCINLIIGLFFGMIMSRTEFSFTGNLRSPIMDKDYSFTKLFFIMTVITCIGINLIIILGLCNGTFDYEAFLARPTRVSVYFLFAAIIFGFGICLLGSAGSGIIRKVVNGKFDFIVAAVFYFIGSVLGVVVRDHAITIFKERSLYMPEMFGWPIAITIQGILIVISYFIIKIKSSKVEKNEKES